MASACWSQGAGSRARGSVGEGQLPARVLFLGDGRQRLVCQPDVAAAPGFERVEIICAPGGAVNSLDRSQARSVDPHRIVIDAGERCLGDAIDPQGGMFLIIDHSPLEAYADHVYYMRLTCGHNNRCVRLGDAIAPLQPLDRSIDENLASVREGLAHLSKAVPPDQQNQEPVSEFDRQVKHIVYLLVAGRISPQTAINQLRGLVRTSEPFLPARLPVIEQTWR